MTKKTEGKNPSFTLKITVLIITMIVGILVATTANKMFDSSKETLLASSNTVENNKKIQTTNVSAIPTTQLEPKNNKTLEDKINNGDIEVVTDNQGRVIKLIDKASAKVLFVFAYGENGQLLSVVSSEGNKATFSYNNLGKLSSVTLDTTILNFKFLSQTSLELSLVINDSKQESVVLELDSKGNFPNLENFSSSAPEIVKTLNYILAPLKVSNVNPFSFLK